MRIHAERNAERRAANGAQYETETQSARPLQQKLGCIFIGGQNSGHHGCLISHVGNAAAHYGVRTLELVPTIQQKVV